MLSFRATITCQQTMNTRRVHELMTANFPSVEDAQLEWTNIADKHRHLVPGQAQAVVEQHFVSQGIEQVVVQVHRKLGARMPTSELLGYLALHLGQGNIRIADRAFSVFSTVAKNGSASSWSKGQSAGNT